MDLPESDAKRIFKSYFGEVRGDLLSTGLIVGFLSMGAAWFVFRFFTSYQLTSLRSLAVGCLFGLLAAFYLIIKEAKHFFALRSDLNNGIYERLSVRPKRGIALDLPNGIPVIALDCGSHTLLLVGDWWKNRQRGEIHWEGSNVRTNFPSTHFSICRLPLSGRVFCVKSDGSKLPIKREKPMEPELKIDIENYFDSYIVAQQLSSLDFNRGRGELRRG
ncbi:hypothetical protein SH501x_002534 [Pirellulaceae bacterium SH501]